MKIALSLPGFSNIDSPNPTSPTGLPPGVPTGGLDTLSNIIGVLIEFALIVGIFFSAYLIIRGGMNMMTSGGDKQKFAQGRERVRYSIIGLIFIFLSFFIVNLIGGFLGINLLSYTSPFRFPPSEYEKCLDLRSKDGLGLELCDYAKPTPTPTKTPTPTPTRTPTPTPWIVQEGEDCGAIQRCAPGLVCEGTRFDNIAQEDVLICTKPKP